MADILRLIGVVSACSLGNLIPAFEVVQRMTDTYAHIKFGRKRCKNIIQRAALVIKEVHGNLPNDQSNITRLQGELEEIQTILQKLAEMSFFKSLLHFEDVNKELERAHRHLNDCSQLFPMINLSSHVLAQNSAATSDREALQALLKILTGNYEEIRCRFGIYSDEQEDQLMAVMERELRNARITSEEDMPVETQIMQKSLECIKATTGRSVPKQKKWLITEYDLEYCGTIGGGGFSTVRKAWFRGTMVAVKTLKDIGNIKEALESEVEIWSSLRNDHIVPFYGASTLTSPPFIVSRYMRNGNLVQYLATTQNADRTKLISEVSLGMYYLHEESVIHGDLKSVNVLVDDSGKACITDFGLSKVYSSGTAGIKTSRISGTLRFTAPEALKGHPLSFETDVYAFGMMIYEVFTEEVPFARESDQMVLRGRVELRRPTSSKVYEHGFDDALWQLLSDCISRDPFVRPRFKTIQEHLRSIRKQAERSAQVVHPDPTSIINGDNLTDWELDTKPTMYPLPSPTDKTVLPRERGKSVPVEKTNTSSEISLLQDLESFPPALAKPLVQPFRLGTEGHNDTECRPETKPTAYFSPVLIDKATLLLPKGRMVPVERSGISSGGSSSASRDIKTFPPISVERSAQLIHPNLMLGIEDSNVTDPGLNGESMTSSHTSVNDTAALLKGGKSRAVDRPSMSEGSISSHIKSSPPILPMCIVVVHKHFSVPFGVSSREPAVCLEKANTVKWQPINANKCTLLYEQGNKFWYRNGTRNGNNSWELTGNDVTLHTAAFKGVCRFRDTKMAQKWFMLQLGYARDGSVGDWGTTMGDWIYTEQSWRRLERSKIQQADLVKKAPNEVPTDRSWIDVNLPKQVIIDDQAGTKNCIVCITNPGKQPGRLCCKIEGRTIVFETYRQPGDKGPAHTREETYPSQEYAEMTFRVMKAILKKTA